MRIRTLLIPFALVAATSVPAQAAGGWQLVRSPEGGAAVLPATSFAGADNGWAVGASGKSLTGTGVDTLIEHWTGAAWQRVPSPAVTQSDEELTGVATSTANDAWAVGWQNPYGTTPIHGLLVHRNGTAWSVVPGPSRAAIPVAVAARTPQDVWAVGTGLTEHFDGHGWTLVKPPSTAARLTGVTILAADDAWAVGSQPRPGTGYRGSVPYVAHWNGTSWSSVAVPAVTEDAALSSVSATNRNDIWAVGHFDTETYALHSDGTSWRIVDTPSPTSPSSLNGVVALSRSNAWAVGYQGGARSDGFAVLRTLTEHWDGTRWTAVASGNDTEDDNFLNAVTAVPGTVWAVGGDDGALIERR